MVASRFALLLSVILTVVMGVGMQARLCVVINPIDELQIPVECNEGSELNLDGHNFMKRLKRVEHKLKRKAELNENEQRMWEVVRLKLRDLVYQHQQTIIFKTPEGEPAGCWLIRAHGDLFGFCCLTELIDYNEEDLRLLFDEELDQLESIQFRDSNEIYFQQETLSTERAQEWGRLEEENLVDEDEPIEISYPIEDDESSSEEPSLESAVRMSYYSSQSIIEEDQHPKERNSTDIESNVEEDVEDEDEGDGSSVFLDLFGPPCELPKEGLCSVLCCNPQFADSAFCFRDVPCYG